MTDEALLRDATYLKWFRDRAIIVDTEPPEDIGDIIVTLEQLAASKLVEVTTWSSANSPGNPPAASTRQTEA